MTDHTEQIAMRLSLRFKWERETARDFIAAAETAGIYLEYVETTHEICPWCATHYATRKEGICHQCATEERDREQQQRDMEEEARLLAESQDREDAIKKARERMREPHDANPRKKTLAGWAVDLARDPKRMERFVAAVEGLSE